MTAGVRWEGGDLLLDLRIQPKASRDGFAGAYGERLKIRITAPPVDGKANDHLVRFLSKQFGVPKSGVELISGQSGRDKRMRVRKPKRLPEKLGPL